MTSEPGVDGDVVTLDVRAFFTRGEEPFRAIMAAVARVRAGGTFRLRVPFEPVPLYRVLGRQGFKHEATQLGPGDWEITFRKAETGAPSLEPWPAPADGPRGAPAAPPRTITFDVSDLVPPEPMLRILEAASKLEPGETLLVQHVRRPVYLYPRLDELGYDHETCELESGKVEITIRRPAGAACR